MRTLERLGAGEPRSSPPVGLAFVGLAVTISVVAIGVAVDPRTLQHFTPATIAHFGAMAATLFAIAGATCAYRAVTAADRSAGMIAFVLMAVASPWSWLVFVGASARATTVGASAVVVVCAVAGLGLLSRSLRSARWLEVFSGLGLVALELSASLIHPSAGETRLLLSLLAVASGVTCLYGSFVEIEVSRHRAQQNLVALREGYRGQTELTESLLHDLRSGLLSIEVAVGTVESELVEPIRIEAARLRKLTAVSSGKDDGQEIFDLVPLVRSLVWLKQASGSPIELETPETSMVRGSAREVLRVVENLLTNAERHGRSPARVQIVESDGETRVAVSDAGRGIGLRAAEAIFERGSSSHPDGLGIGLHHSRLLATKNGGDLTVEISTDGRPTFLLSLVPNRTGRLQASSGTS